MGQTNWDNRGLLLPTFAENPRNPYQKFGQSGLNTQTSRSSQVVRISNLEKVWVCSFQMDPKFSEPNLPSKLRNIYPKGKLIKQRTQLQHLTN